MPKRKEWFGEWFDSPYYHILYKNRDYEEAQAFINIATEYLKVSINDKIMDLACGKGRHSIYMNKKGFDVVGLDLSAQSIEFANQFKNERLHFHIHDMREVYENEAFDFIFNFFTSFGYFETKQEHEEAIISVAKALKKGGVFLLDFLNPYTVINHLVSKEIKVIQNIEFAISKDITADGYIIKDIQFNDNGIHHHFQEKVKALRKTDFLEYFKKAELEVVDIFGDYKLGSYQAEQSDRMIFVVKKR